MNFISPDKQSHPLSLLSPTYLFDLLFQLFCREAQRPHSSCPACTLQLGHTQAVNTFLGNHLCTENRDQINITSFFRKLKPCPFLQQAYTLEGSKYISHVVEPNGLFLAMWVLGLGLPSAALIFKYSSALRRS